MIYVIFPASFTRQQGSNALVTDAALKSAFTPKISSCEPSGPPRGELQRMVQHIRTTPPVTGIVTLLRLTTPKYKGTTVGLRLRIVSGERL